jgi:hypothetical protein
MTAFENRVLRKIFGPMRAKVTRELRELRNEELNDLNSSSNIIRVIKSNIIRVIKSRRIGWAGHVARMGGEERYIQCFGSETIGKETTTWKIQL